MKHLTKEQRYEISAYLKCDKTKIFIAKALGVDRSTIGRELQRNSTKHGKYFPEHAYKLIRQYIPKKSNFNDLSNQDISMIQKKINARLF